MNTISVNMTPVQVALVLDLLKPYTELSMSLSNQYKQQLAQSSMPVRAKKVEDQIPEDNNGKH